MARARNTGIGKKERGGGTENKRHEGGRGWCFLLRSLSAVL